MVNDVDVAPPHPDACPRCGRVLLVGDFPFCKGEPRDHGTYAHRPFTPYEVDLGEGLGKVKIDSIQAADRLERETERAWRNGEKDRRGKPIGPIVLRVFHQDKSNLDKSVFEPTKFETPWRDEPRRRR